MRHLYKLTMVLAMLSFSAGLSAQVRSSIGFAYGINKASDGGYKIGTGSMLQATIRVTDKIGIVPAFCYERVTADGSPAKDIYHGIARNFDLVYFGLSVKYHFYKDLFVRVGPIFYLLDESDSNDFPHANIGGSGVLGYNLNVDDHNTIEFSAGPSFIRSQTTVGAMSITSIKVAYNFNFRGPE